MDKLIGYLTDKIGYTLCAIFFFGFPGLIFVFVWNRELFVELDIFKLCFLSFAITFMVFIPNLFYGAYVVALEEKTRKMKSDIVNILSISISLTFLAMSAGMMYKLEHNQFTIMLFIKSMLGFLLIGAVLKAVTELIYYLIHKNKKTSNLTKNDE